MEGTTIQQESHITPEESSVQHGSETQIEKLPEDTHTKYGPAEDGSYYTPYSHTFVSRAGNIISECLAGAYASLGERAQIITLSPVAPAEEFWTLADHPSRHIIFSDVSAQDSLKEFCAGKGFLSITFLAGPVYSGDDYLALEFVHLVLPREASHLAVRQMIDMCIRTKITSWSSLFVPENPSIGQPFGLKDAQDLIRGVASLGMLVREAACKVACSPLHAEEYLRDWVAAGKASEAIYSILSKNSAKTAKTKYIESNFTITTSESTGDITTNTRTGHSRVISVVVAGLIHKVREEIANNLTEYKEGPTVILTYFPSSQPGLWEVRSVIHSLGFAGETPADVINYLEEKNKNHEIDDYYLISVSDLPHLIDAFIEVPAENKEIACTIEPTENLTILQDAAEPEELDSD